jgi:hypothetical protein
MTILDYLLLAGFVAAALYTGYRLFVGWLRSRSPQTLDQGREVGSSTKLKPAETGFITGAPWQSRD